MFICDEIPNDFNRIAEISDNYIILVKENKLLNDHSYEAYLQFFDHSATCLYLSNYKITNGDTYTYDYHYTNNQYYSYIDYVETSFSKDTIPLSNRSNGLFDRFDISNILVMVALFLALTIMIVNLATSLVHRGGIFHA